MTDERVKDDPQRLHVLVSFAYWRKKKLLDRLPPEWNLMLDSGAFTNFTQGKEVVTLPDFAAFCKDNQGKFWRVLNLDKIGDHQQSEQNANYLRRQGINVVPVFQRGDSPKSLRRMAENSDLVAIGGISQNLAAKAEQAYVRDVMRLSRKYGMNVHLLGAGRAELMRYLPFSGDNSTWTSACRFGIFYAWHRGRVLRFSKIPALSGKKEYVRPKNEWKRVISGYGLRWSQLLDAAEWRPKGAVSIAHTRSWIRMARDFARNDTRYIFAVVPAMMDNLLTAWELEKHQWPTTIKETPCLTMAPPTT